MSIRVVVVQDQALSELISGISSVAAGVMPNTVSGMKAIANRVLAGTWKAYALGAVIPGTTFQVKHPNGGYARGIKVEKRGSFNYDIFSDDAIADWIENGTNEVDMKETHPYGPKGRVAKKRIPKRFGGGFRYVPYLIVPFRWGKSGSSGTHMRNTIPEEIDIAISQALSSGEVEKSQVLKSIHTEPNYWGDEVRRREYQWGSRLHFADPALKRLEGMVIMDTSSKKAVSSTYFTFRVISADSPSPSWIKPATPARNITQYVEANTREIRERLIETALKKDLGL